MTAGRKNGAGKAEWRTSMRVQRKRKCRARRSGTRHSGRERRDSGGRLVAQAALHERLAIVTLLAGG
ncbi:hypothetical protein M3643_12660, partial [Staphylococcus lugdunensis]|nr:hypothetical protein [Staphylococcus lugdunensis]